MGWFSRFTNKGHSTTDGSVGSAPVEGKAPTELPTTTKVFEHGFEDVVKGYLKFALKPEESSKASVVIITTTNDSVTYTRNKSKTVNIPWLIMRTLNTTNEVKFKQIYTIFPKERKMTVHIDPISHTNLGNMSESEIYYAVGNKTHLTRHANFGFAGNSSWFGMKNKLENLIIGKFMKEANRHDFSMDKYIQLAMLDTTYNWEDIISGRWNPHF